MIFRHLRNLGQAGLMDAFFSQKDSLRKTRGCGGEEFDRLRGRVRQWQQVRTWARLINEVQSLWHVDERELRRIGALELSQLLLEVPFSQRSRVRRWACRYATLTKFKSTDR